MVCGWFHMSLWDGIEVGMRGLRNRRSRMLFGLKPYGVRTYIVYGQKSNHQNLINLFLYETIHLELSNHIKYEVIGLVLQELWIFKIYLRILCSLLNSMSCEGCNSSYLIQNWIQQILLESLHIGQHPIKISEFDIILIAPSNSMKLP